MAHPADSRDPPRGRQSFGTFLHSFVVRPRPLPVALSLAAIAVMVGLGVFIIDRYRALKLHSYGEVASVYVDHLLAPYALSQLATGEQIDAAAPDLGDVIGEVPAASVPIVLRIWRPDGTLFYSSLKEDMIDLHDAAQLHDAISGAAVLSLEIEGDGDGFPMPYPYFEIYAPIHDPDSGRLVAVGEIYQDAAAIMRDRAFVETTVWAAIALATAGVLALLLLSARQSEQLRAYLEDERRMATENDHLRQAAEQSRRDATQANEQVLNLVGAELHDGPVQLLGLMALMEEGGAAAPGPDMPARQDLAAQVLAQLRTISAGLILPEVEDLDAGAVVALAAARHRALNGGEVALEADLQGLEMDAPRKVCLYRIVQEGLANAARHGEGEVPLVRAARSGTVLQVAIRGGNLRSPDGTTLSPTRGLGLQGMRRRLDAFGGEIHLDREVGQMLLRVALPLPEADGRPRLS